LPLKDAYDGVICFVFSVSPEPFVGQVNRATAQTSHNRAMDEGLVPLQRFVRGFLNRIIAEDFGSPDLEFVWQDGREQDPAQAAQIDELLDLRHIYARFAVIRILLKRHVLAVGWIL
jgi:hypothetical protein